MRSVVNQSRYGVLVRNVMFITEIVTGVRYGKSNDRQFLPD